MTPTMNRFAVWFRWAVWLGIVVDWLTSAPAIFAPNWTLTLLGQRGSTSPTWVAFSSLLVVLLSLFYIPAATAPERYPVSAWLAVVGRLCQALFFLLIYGGLYTGHGTLYLILFLVQAPLLVLMMRDPRFSSSRLRSWPPP